MAKIETRCQTPRCIDEITRYGERYHGVHSAWLGSDHVAMCERCGGKLLADGTWQHRCKKCGGNVQPGELTGLFVPHSCHACLQAVRAEQKASGSTCISCKKPLCDCYC